MRARWALIPAELRVRMRKISTGGLPPSLFDGVTQSRQFARQQGESGLVLKAVLDHLRHLAIEVNAVLIDSRLGLDAVGQEQPLGHALVPGVCRRQLDLSLAAARDEGSQE